MVKLDRYTAVDDVERVINPSIVDGQIHGGIVLGAGQALMERCFFDEKTAQPYAGSFMDYALPRAIDMPFFLRPLSRGDQHTKSSWCKIWR